MTQNKPPTCLNYIGGQWKAAISGETMASSNPAKPQELVGYAQKSSLADLDDAVNAAKMAKDVWRKTASPVRGEYLERTADILEKRLQEIAETTTREMGKSLPEAKGETIRGIALLRYYAGEGMYKTGDVIPTTDGEAFMFTDRVPLGVVGVITPWNFPVSIPIWKMAPALAYGNTIVIKTAQEAAVTGSKVIECFADAGFPDGVINMVTGSGSVIGQGIIDHPDINAITFTGSNAVGKRVAAGAAARGAKYQLEMGGKNPVIVAADADLNLAVEATVSGAFRSTGQKCTATSRAIIHRQVYELFKEKLLKRIQKLKIGYGLDTDTWMGPVANKDQLQTVLAYIEKGKEEGATLLCGGKRCDTEKLKYGYFVEPTVFENVRKDMTIFREEIFGPVLALVKFDSIEEALQIANDVKYGLSASIFTRDIGTMFHFIKDMEAGLVRINAESAGLELQAPFGGLKESSSYSREQGQGAKEFFTSTRTIYVKP
ncbi:MAG: aldehyde dehydrogenase family protein [Acidaminococcales bacterium]|jgi:aldehyde dehydrogenase (NAD+)|nr:aldehyde dehydrogenase family protein [Acidaminococcales bacterium]